MIVKESDRDKDRAPPEHPRLDKTSCLADSWRKQKGFLRPFSRKRPLNAPRLVHNSSSSTRISNPIPLSLCCSSWRPSLLVLLQNLKGSFCLASNDTSWASAEHTGSVRIKGFPKSACVRSPCALYCRRRLRASTAPGIGVDPTCRVPERSMRRA